MKGDKIAASRKINRVFVDEIISIAEARTIASGANKKTFTRHKCAINACELVLGMSRDKIYKPGVWLKFSQSAISSTTVSNMKFIAVILEWASEQDEYPDKELYKKTADAIRQACAIRGE
ncbi:hypothetical protein [Yersinia massiliensis]|uniref:hypothetical protein n=1 Tax=Yersinia massiliensis TaxID=419257 RepID=UPI001CFD7808|nr:hypothetical protein [Yersinia massiliensis]MCB5308319.1 hypothetical protein [Yersinia massiliensis]